MNTFKVTLNKMADNKVIFVKEFETKRKATKFINDFAKEKGLKNTFSKNINWGG